MSTDDAAIRDYLDRYADSLARFDAESSAALWSTPGMIASDAFSGVLDSRELMAEGLQQSYPLYRRLGLASVGYELLDEDRLTGKLVMVKVRWLFFDEADELLTDSTNHYLLRDEDSGLRAVLCVETDSEQKIRALAERLGVELG